MRYRWQAYECPSTVEDALSVLRRHQGRAALIAGGTDLVVDLDRNDMVIPAVVDLMAIPALQTVRDLGSAWEIGAAVTLSQILQHQGLCEFAPHLKHAIEGIGSIQIRNAGTLVGNVTNASPAADAVLPLLTMDASIVVLGRKGERVLPLKDFFIGPGSTRCDAEEIVTSLRLPKPEFPWTGAFEKLGLRQAMAIAVVNVAGNLLWVNGEVAQARLALGAVAPTPMLAEQAAHILVGTKLEDEAIREASRLAREAATPIDDVRASASYRSKMVQVLTWRCLARIREHLEG